MTWSTFCEALTPGADIWPIKLSSPLTEIVADVKTQSGTRVGPWQMLLATLQRLADIARHVI